MAAKTNEQREAEEASRDVLAKHTKVAWCCHADRGPCVLNDGHRHLCGAATCRVCEPSPYDGTHKPVYPCQPVILASLFLGEKVD